MLTIPSLSRQDVGRFEEDGWLIVPSAFSASDMANILAWTDDIATRPEEPGKHWVYHEQSLQDGGTDLINRIENMTPFHPGFAELANSLLPSVGDLFGEEAILFKDKINFKMSGGSGFEPHQDWQAGWDEYASYYMTVMVCLDHATIDNGCLKLVDKRRRELVGKSWEPLTEDQTADMEFVPRPTQPGDLIYFDCFTPHASEPNMTDKGRRLYFATYNRLSDGDQRDRYLADKRSNFPPDVERLPGKEYVYRV